MIRKTKERARERENMIVMEDLDVQIEDVASLGLFTVHEIVQK